MSFIRRMDTVNTYPHTQGLNNNSEGFLHADLILDGYDLDVLVHLGAQSVISFVYINVLLQLASVSLEADYVTTG